jgi:hypothetical protein
MGTSRDTSPHPPASGGDEATIRALALGWEMSRLYAAPKARSRGPRVLPGSLPSESELRAGQRTRAGIAKIEFLIDRLLPDTSSTGKQVPSVEPLREDPGGDATRWKRLVFDLHLLLVVELRAIDMGLFHAYDLGRGLSDICRRPARIADLAQRFERHRVTELQGRLADLSTRLPDHAAAAVSATLPEWTKWVAIEPLQPQKRRAAQIRSSLTRQGTLWRALLTGEKDGRQMLGPQDFVSAALRLAGELGMLIRGLLGVYRFAVGLVALTTIAVIATAIASAGTPSVIASLGALAASLGVTRKGIDLTVREAIDELRKRIWGAELDEAIAVEILRLPYREPPTPAPTPPIKRWRWIRRRRARKVASQQSEAPIGALSVRASGPETAEPPGDN